MGDEPTPAELRRTLADVRDDIRERHSHLNQRIDRCLPLDLYRAHVESSQREHDELAKDIADLRAALSADQDRRAADRRMILTALFTSILAPLALLLIQAYLSVRGAP